MGFAYSEIHCAAAAAANIDLLSSSSFNFDFLANQWPNSHDNQFFDPTVEFYVHTASKWRSSKLKVAYFSLVQKEQVSYCLPALTHKRIQFSFITIKVALLHYLLWLCCYLSLTERGVLRKKPRANNLFALNCKNFQSAATSDGRQAGSRTAQGEILQRQQLKRATTMIHIAPKFMKKSNSSAIIARLK